MDIKIRKQEIEDFKTGKSKIFMIQSDVGKEALTLPEAQYTIFLDRHFAQGFNDQAEARMTPIDGGTCTKYVLDLIMKDTVEEFIYDKLIIRKEDIKNVNEIFEKGEQ
jgi:SNF2 family DNA or RNA helicase